MLSSLSSLDEWMAARADFFRIHWLRLEPCATTRTAVSGSGDSWRSRSRYKQHTVFVFQRARSRPPSRGHVLRREVTSSVARSRPSSLGHVLFLQWTRRHPRAGRESTPWPMHRLPRRIRNTGIAPAPHTQPRHPAPLRQAARNTRPTPAGGRSDAPCRPRTYSAWKTRKTRRPFHQASPPPGPGRSRDAGAAGRQPGDDPPGARAGSGGREAV